MRKTLSAVAAIGLSCLIASATIAQTVPVAETSLPAVVDVPAPESAAVPLATVPKGTPIVVEITDLVTTRTAKRDDMFNLTLAEPVLLNSVVVIPAGTPGKGQVIDAGKPDMGGKPGKLVLAVRYLEFEGRQIPIRGLNLGLYAADKSNTAAWVGAAAGVLGLAVVGGHMEVSAGTRAGAKLGADFVPSPAVLSSLAPEPTDGVDPTSTPQPIQ
jgi:hypothetical protein